MKALNERMLYVTLLLVFVGNGVGIWLGARTAQQIQDSVVALKKDNAQQTEYIRCLMAAHDLGQFDISGCKRPSDGGLTSSQLQPTSSAPAQNSARVNSPTSHPSAPPGGGSAPSTSPSPPKPLTQQVRGVITDLLHRVGL